jgi:hypothetical protein
MPTIAEAHRDADHRRSEARVDHQGAGAEGEPPDADRGVHGGQLGPPMAALQHALLSTHHRQAGQGRCEQENRQPRIDVQQPDQQRRREHDHGEQPKRGATSRLQQGIGQRGLARAGVGGDPPGA